MKSRIWRLAGVGLLCVSVSAQTMADEQQNRGHDGGQHGQGGHQGDNQGHGGGNQPHPQNGQQQNLPRAQNNDNRQYEHSGQDQRQDNDQRQSRPAPDYNSRVRSPPPPPQMPATDMPIQPRPDTVGQTREPPHGYDQNQPRRNDYNKHWNGYIGAPSNDTHWEGRPSGRGNGWGPGPKYRPGHVIDRFPERDYRVPYRGMDYYYSGGYWYRPLGPRYVVVEPPRGFVSGTCPITPSRCGSAGRCCSWRQVPITPISKALRTTSWSNRRLANRNLQPATVVMTWRPIQPTVSRRNRSAGMVTSVINMRCSRVVSIHEPPPTGQTRRWCKPTDRPRVTA